MEKEKKEYKNKVVFLWKSKAGDHLFAFNNDNVLGTEVKSILMNVVEVMAVLDGSAQVAKISIMPVDKEDKKDANNGKN